MKVSELIGALQSCDPDKVVYFDNEDGDVEVDLVMAVDTKNGVRLNNKSLYVSKVLCSPEGRTALSMEMRRAIRIARMGVNPTPMSPEDWARLDASLAEAAKTDQMSAKLLERLRDRK